jgi:hypothetical protein
MAIVLFGGVVGRISGRVGGAVFARRGGADVLSGFGRVRASASKEALCVKNAYSRCAAVWRGKSAAERARWVAQGRDIREPNAVGVARALGGFQLYLLAAMPYAMCGLAVEVYGEVRPRRSQSGYLSAADMMGELYLFYVPASYPGEAVQDFAFVRIARTFRIGERRAVRRWSYVPWMITSSVSLYVRDFLGPRQGIPAVGERLLIEHRACNAPYLPSAVRQREADYVGA